MPIGGFGVLTENHSRDIIGDFSAASTAVISATTFNQFGSWVELLSDVGDRDILITHVVIFMASTFLNSRLELEIGIGASSSEAREFGIVTHHYDASGVDSGPQIFPINRRIPSGSRLSARIKDQSNTAHVYRIPINYIKL